MNSHAQADDTRTLKSEGVRSLFDTEVNIKIRILTIIALAGAVGNTLGFLANLFLHGFNFVTGFCAVCAVLIILNLFFGLKSKYGVALGYVMLFLLDVLEFPLLTLTYGAVMYPYMLIGFHALMMISEKSRRIYLAILLGIFDILIIAYSSLHPYIFGPQDAIGLMGSAIVTFAISLFTVASLVIIWQNVYLVDTIEIDAITKVQSQIGFVKNVRKVLHGDAKTDYLLLYFNVFSFKAINSIYGIEGGNRFLQATAEHLSQSSLSPRLIGRLNADRFVCLVEKNNLNLERLTEICQIPFEENGRRILVNLHCGIYEIEDGDDSVTSMIDRASTAIKFVHSAGNKHYAFYDHQAEERYREETIVLAEIDKAISEGEFCPFYQPIVDCQTKEIVSAEALARWINPEMGTISPGIFIPVLEKKNLISNLDLLMARNVKNFILNRLSNHQKIVPISVNLSRDDFFDHEMMQEIRDMVQKFSHRDYCPRLEVTESVYEGISEHMLNALAELRKNGAEILVDDFGSGYSSLGMITDYEFDVIKLDMQFSRKIVDNERIVGVVQSIIDMSHKLGARVVAEGVETEEQFKILKACGCDYVQGYYFFKPMSEQDFIELLDN